MLGLLENRIAAVKSRFEMLLAACPLRQGDRARSPPKQCRPGSEM